MISVIIPVYNDPIGLRDTLESLVNQKTGHDYEILVVDNKSTDQTSEVIKEFEEEYSDLIKSLEENQIQSSYAARNRGLEDAKGDIICFLDSDMWVQQDYLDNVHSYFDLNEGVDYLGCQVEIIDRSEGKASAFYDKKTGFDVQSYFEKRSFVPTCCLSVRSEVFKEVGGFNQELVSGGDKEFGRRVSKSNFGMEYLGDITVYHPARDSWRSINRKYFRIGRGDCQLQKIEGERFIEDAGVLHLLKKVINSPKVPSKLIEGSESFNFKVRLIFVFLVKRFSYFSGYWYQKLLSEN